jgi:putative DNA primase/helicase
MGGADINYIRCTEGMNPLHAQFDAEASKALEAREHQRALREIATGEPDVLNGDEGTDKSKHPAQDQVPEPEQEDVRPPEFSDDALADAFAERHRHDLRYVAPWGRWLHFDGRCWKQDDTLIAFDRVRMLCRGATADCTEMRVWMSVASAKTVAAVEKLAKADRRLAATVDQWDADPWLMNTPGAVIDLRTGESRPTQQTDYMTKTTAVSPGGDCPLWKSVIRRITDGDPDLARYLQRAMGYALTGITREHALFFCYGTGANGKSVVIRTIADIAGSYHREAAIETFTASKHERHPTDLAGLQGARIVTSVETEGGRNWAEAKIKALTGGDKVAARFMRQDFFEYVPQFKLIIAGNHKPGLRCVNEAIRRRLHLIPFAVTIPPEERDQHLSEKLKAEWSGILAWMIEGCLDWQCEGLSPPTAVRDATDAYLADEDALGNWIDDACERDPQAWESSTSLFNSWKSWAERSGEPSVSQKAFVHALESHGLIRHRLQRARGFAGLRVIEHAGN